jgi:DNA-binding response OmpR family regulator
VIAPRPSSDEERALLLVVERDPHMRELEMFFLQDAGYAVDFAEDGVAALAMARERKPAIVVTEIMVPKLDGLALCRSIKQDPGLASTVVLIFSILAAQERAREAGADAFLMKPLAERRLVETVQSLLATRRATSRAPEEGQVQ